MTFLGIYLAAGFGFVLGLVKRAGGLGVVLQNGGGWRDPAKASVLVVLVWPIVLLSRRWPG